MLEEKDRQNPTPLKTHERWGELSAYKLFAAIEHTRTISVDLFIYALGILHIGEVTARDCLSYENFEHWWTSLKQAVDIKSIAYEELTNIEGIGDIVATSLINFSSEPKNQLMVKSL